MNGKKCRAPSNVSSWRLIAGMRLTGAKVLCSTLQRMRLNDAALYLILQLLDGPMPFIGSSVKLGRTNNLLLGAGQNFMPLIIIGQEHDSLNSKDQRTEKRQMLKRSQRLRVKPVAFLSNLPIGLSFSSNMLEMPWAFPAPYSK